MKRISILLLLFTTLTIFSCEGFGEYECMECEIYNDYHNFVEYYSSECGDSYDLNRYIDDANAYAWDYYGGYAECYKVE